MAKLKFANCGAVPIVGQAMPKSTTLAKMASMSPVAQLGYVQGYINSVMPAEEVFDKVAAKTRIDKAFIKRAYIEKVALRPLAALLAGGGAALALPLLNKMIHGYHRPSQQLSPFHEDLRNNAMYNQTVSRDLQGVQGAFAPAADPLGKMGSAEKKAMGAANGAMLGSTVGSLGGLPGMALGAGLGALGGWGYNKLFGQGYKQPNQKLSPFHRNLRDMAMYNQTVSRDLQGIRGAFAPAPNPWGGPGQGMM